MKRTHGPDLGVISGRFVVGAGFLGIWQLLVSIHWLDHFFFSSPVDVLARMFSLFGDQQQHIGLDLLTTLTEASLSFVIGTALGITAGFLLGNNKPLAEIFGPYLQIGNAVPRVVLAPVFLIWFGLGIWSKVALGVTVVFFIAFFNTYQGTRSVPVHIINNVRMLGASDWQVTRHVVVPSVLSWVFSSLHVSVGFAIISAVVGEYLGASHGIGHFISQAEGTYSTTDVFAGIGLLSIVVLILSAAIDRIEARLVKWRPRGTALSSDVA